MKIVNYDNLALIEIVESKGEKMVHLLATINPDANEPLQGESYGGEWTLSCKEAATQIRSHEGPGGFWNVWTTINGMVCGGIDLYDGMEPEEAEKFMRVGEIAEFYGDDNQLAALIEILPVGEYLFQVLNPGTQHKYIVALATNKTKDDSDMKLSVKGPYDTWEDAQTAMNAFARWYAEEIHVDFDDKAAVHILNDEFCIYDGPDYMYGQIKCLLV